MTECQAETQGWDMLPCAQTDLWDETLLRTAARAFRAWRHAVAQVPLVGCSFITPEILWDKNLHINCTSVIESVFNCSFIFRAL